MTGIYRAVKIVQRQDFEWEKNFEREFEGVQRYERVSRDHPGLVDVLHVGRDPDKQFYYYVMELADDQAGQNIEEIDPESYNARTLYSDLQQIRSRDIEDCIALGGKLAEALAHLHQSGLTHRDVKPANIIFINGEPCLADIGLVAPSGQQTYVGTEGYLPPEGPGTSSSDLYGLAIVIYEMHTGKSRLDFPALPDTQELSPTINRDEWRALNKVIFRAAAPDPRKRFETGLVFANALRKIRPAEGADAPATATLKERILEHPQLQQAVEKAVDLTASTWNKIEAKKIPNRAWAAIAGGILLIIVISLISTRTSGKKTTPETDLATNAPPKQVIPEVPEQPSPAPVQETKPATIPNLSLREKKPSVKIDSIPGGATVSLDEQEIGRTPIPYRLYDSGKLKFVFTKEGFHQKVETIDIESGDSILVRAELKKDLGPVTGKIWKNSGDLLQFFPQPNDNFVAPVTSYAYEEFLKTTGRAYAISAKEGVVLVKDPDVQWAFCDWLTQRDRTAGYLKDTLYYAPAQPPGDAPRDWFYCRIATGFNSLVFEGEPEAAEVYDRDQVVLTTPGWLKYRRGPYNLEVRKGGYQAQPVSGYLRDEIITIPIKLERDSSLLFGTTWKNSLGMPMVPIGKMMVGILETRVRDIDHFMMMTNHRRESIADSLQTPDEPIIKVSRADAEAFCQWLTDKERSEKLIQSWHQYRLPTDREWSELAGLPSEKGRTPKDREREVSHNFPWGTQWPPTAMSGNFADEAAVGLFGKYVIQGYHDGFSKTSPVGSFQPSKNGLYDVGGNVWEWVSDPYDSDSKNLGVVRGGGWNSYEKGVLYSSYRHAVDPNSRSEFFGFRYILVDTRTKPFQ